MIGWHISNGSTVSDLEEEWEGYEYHNPYDIYIIGGNDSTTEGDNCLLSNIHQAIGLVFNSESQVKIELVNLGKKTQLKYVSANLHLDGTLSLCYHN